MIHNYTETSGNKKSRFRIEELSVAGMKRIFTQKPKGLHEVWKVRSALIPVIEQLEEMLNVETFHHNDEYSDIGIKSPFELLCELRGELYFLNWYIDQHNQNVCLETAVNSLRRDFYNRMTAEYLLTYIDIAIDDNVLPHDFGITEFIDDKFYSDVEFIHTLEFIDSVIFGCHWIHGNEK